MVKFWLTISACVVLMALIIAWPTGQEPIRPIQAGAFISVSASATPETKQFYQLNVSEVVNETTDNNEL